MGNLFNLKKLLLAAFVIAILLASSIYIYKAYGQVTPTSPEPTVSFQKRSFNTSNGTAGAPVSINSVASFRDAHTGRDEVVIRWLSAAGVPVYFNRGCADTTPDYVVMIITDAFSGNSGAFDFNIRNPSTGTGESHRTRLDFVQPNSNTAPRFAEGKTWRVIINNEWWYGTVATCTRATGSDEIIFSIDDEDPSVAFSGFDADTTTGANPVNVPITVTFSERVKSSGTGDSSITLLDANGLKGITTFTDGAGTVINSNNFDFVRNEAGKRFTITPKAASPFPNDQLISISVSGFKDIANSPSTGPTSTSFRVAQDVPASFTDPDAFSATVTVIDDIVVGIGILKVVELPELSTGNLPISYTITNPMPLPTGISFNIATRELTIERSTVLGKTALTYVGTDRDGETDSIGFFVTVRDITAPAIVIPDPLNLDMLATVGTSGEITVAGKKYLGIGDGVTVSFNTTENLSVTPSVTIAGIQATVSGSGTDWIAEYTVRDLPTRPIQGKLIYDIGTLTDVVPSTETPNTYDPPAVEVDDIIIDTIVPSVSNINLSTTNSTNSAYAKVGDKITVRFDTELLSSLPVVKIEGRDAAVTSTISGEEATHHAVITVASGDDDGNLHYDIEVLTDIAGNTSDPNSIATDTIRIDKLSPSITGKNVEFTGEVVGTDGKTYLNAGDTIVFSYTFSEELSANTFQGTVKTGEFTGRGFLFTKEGTTNLDGSATYKSAIYTVGGNENANPGSIDLGLVLDRAGNRFNNPEDITDNFVIDTTTTRLYQGLILPH